MTASKTMDVDWGHVTEQMLNLTLEIIYLLTGEDYILVKTSGLCVISRNHPFGCGKFGMTQSSMMTPPTFCLKSEKNNMQKILEVTQKIIELLTGEVPIRCQDVSVYFSTEEWEYLEGHRDLYKDVMIENEPPLTSPDGSSKRNPPERCPSPLYSRDSTQKHYEILHQDQGEDVITIKAEVYDNEEEPYVRGDEPCKEVEMPPEISTDGSSKRSPPERCLRPLYSRDSTQEHHEIPEARPLYSQDSTQEHHEIPQARVLYSQEHHEIPQARPLYSRDSTQEHHEIPEARPLYSQDSTQEDYTIPHHDQFENDVEHEVYMTAYQQCKEEECPIEINTADEHDVMRTLKGHLRLSPCWDREDNNITEVSPREDRATPPVHPGLNRPPTPSILQESSSDLSLSLIPDSNLGLCGADWPSGPGNPEETVHHKALRGNKLHLCTFCGKRFTTHANVVRHVRTHTGDRPYSCSLCGKSFTQKSILLNHQKVHTGDRPFPCPDCGKCFAKSSDVIRHRRVHTGERPYLCLECGKSFTQKFRLRNHQHFHKEEEQSRRLECGWGLASKSNQFG